MNAERPSATYDLEARTTVFAKQVIDFSRTVAVTVITRPLISQLIRAATSIGANYVEANHAISKADFRNKVFISRKEASETAYWLELITHTVPQTKILAEPLQKEADALTRIFSAICKKCSIPTSS